MDETDLVEFLNKMKRVHAANLDDGVEAQPNTIEVPYAAREALLTRLRDDLFEQAMAFDPKKLASGGSVVTAAIEASYQPLDTKTDEYEFCIRDFLKNLLDVVGIEDENPTFTRSRVINEQEQIQTVLSAGQYLPQEYVTRKILTILGDGDQADDIIKEMEAEDLKRMSGIGDEKDDDETEPGEGAQNPEGEEE